VHQPTAPTACQPINFIHILIKPSTSYILCPNQPAQHAARAQTNLSAAHTAVLPIITASASRSHSLPSHQFLTNPDKTNQPSMQRVPKHNLQAAHAAVLPTISAL
jgi:hypothetical protein